MPTKRLGLIHRYFDPYAMGQTDEMTAKFHWLLKLRWIALIAQLASIFPGLILGFLPQERISMFLAVIFMMTIINKISFFSAKRLGPARPFHLFIQLLIDLMGLLALLSLTGGLRNPFVALLFFHAALSSLLLTNRWNFIYFGFLMGGLVILCLAPGPLAYIDQPIHKAVLLFSQLTAAFVIWNLTSWLSETLAHSRSQVHQLEQHHNRMDRLRAVGALASGFSHEFATPLNTVKLQLDRIERKMHPKDLVARRNDFQIAKAAIEQCELSLKSLLKGQVDEENLHLQTLSLDSFLRRVCESWQSEHPQVPLDLRIPLEGSFLCKASHLSLSQTLLNLLDNAFQSTDQAQITVELSVENKWLELCIRDDGPGVSPLVLKKIGEPFLTTKIDGSGLGLFNAVNLISALGGCFEIQNLPQGGAEAKIRLPQETAAL